MAHEFSKYKKLGGAYHWDPKKAGPDYLRHVNNVVEWITENSVLDIGGGDGYICHRLREAGHEVLIIDNEPYAIELATEKGQPCLEADIYNLPLEVTERQWDAIYLGDIIEHLDEPAKAIKVCGELTDVLYIATPPAKINGQFNSVYHTMEFTPFQLRKFMRDLGWTQTMLIVKNYRIFARYVK